MVIIELKANKNATQNSHDKLRLEKRNLFCSAHYLWGYILYVCCCYVDVCANLSVEIVRNGVN